MSGKTLLITTSVLIGISVTFFILEEWFLMFAVIGIYCCLLLLFNRLYNLFNWVDPTILFVINYVTFIGIGIVFAKLYNIKLSPYVLLSLPIGLAAFLMGAIIFDTLTHPVGRIKTKYPLITLSSYYSLEKSWAWLFFLAGILIISYYYYIVGTIPLLAVNAENVRVTVKAGRGYLPIFAYAFFAISVMKIMAMASLQSTKKILFASVVAMFAGILMLGVGFRAPALKLLLDVFIIYTYIQRRKIPFTWLLVVSSLILIIVGILGYFRLESGLTSNIALIFRIGIWRVFVNNLSVLNKIIDLFPASEPYMLGKSYLIDATTLLPGSQPHFGFWLKDRLGLTFDGGGVTQTVIGELYLNWSWIGVLVGMFILGILFRQLFRILTQKNPATTSNLVLMTLFSTSLMGIVSSGILLVLLFDTLPLVIVFVVYLFCVRVSLSLLRSNKTSINCTSASL